MATASTNAWLTHHGELEATCHHDPKEEGQWLSSPPPTRARIRAAKNAELAGRISCPHSRNVDLRDIRRKMYFKQRRSVPPDLSFRARREAGLFQ
jgi:hypothetical protein